jgi:hypothetical protein
LSNAIQETIDALSELKRLHQLNFELLEQLNVACQWIIDSHLCIPNEEKMRSLIGKSLILLNEIQADEPKVLQYQKLADEKKQPFTTADKETEPFFGFWCLFGSWCGVVRVGSWGF